MPELRPEAMAVTSLVTIEGFKLAKDVLPPITEVRRRSATDDGFRAELRTAEAFAATAILIGATSVTAITGNQTPLWLGLATVTAMVLLYEGALAKGTPAVVVDVREEGAA